MRLRSAVAIAVAIFASSSSAAASNALEPTHISLPSGPGSIEGLGRNFAPSLASGTASYGVDIAVPPAAGGFGPQLSLDYDSSGGDTELGMGWRLSGLPTVRRRTEEGLPRFTDDDPMELSGVGVACDLLQVSPGTFRPEYESGAFVRVQKAGPDTWQARDRSGTTWNFGGGPAFEEAEGANVATYLPSEALDLHGHKIAFTWDTSSGAALLQSVVWNDFGPSARNEIVFSYEVRPDPHTMFSAGIRQVQGKRMTAIEVQHGGLLVRRYVLTYAQDVHSRLATVTLIGRDGVSKLPTLSLGYTAQALAPQIVTMQNAPGRTPGDPNIEISDLNGDGLPDLLVTLAGQYSSFINQDGTSWLSESDWSPAQSPSMALGQIGVQLADLDGDGAIDLVAKTGTDDFRYFPGNTATSFRDPVQIATVPNFTFEDPDTKLADMDDDRLIDVVMTTADGIAIGYNRGGVDWTLPQIIGPVDPNQALRFSDGGHTQLCDINGDRVEDFCYLTPGSLAYWLGRGRGIFEPAQVATGVPTFDPSSPWELHDLNGDGWLDLVHVDPDQVEIALAHAPGQFDPPQIVTTVPTKNPTTTIRYADMNGSGTLDIVWIDVTGDQAKAWQYVEFFPAGHAGLLQRIDNGLGKVTTMTYGPAALDAAAARTAGRPWTTRMNVPMTVVRSVKVDDSLGDPVMETDYSYADGTWSPAERTFAGFGGGSDKDLGDAYTPTLVTTSTFDVGLDDWTKRGVVLTTQTGDESGTTFSSTQATWTTRQLQTAMDGRTVDYSFKSSEQTNHIEGSDPSKARLTLIEWDEDAYGNTISEHNWGEVVGGNKLAGSDEAVTLRTFANDTTDWILGRLASEEVQDAAGRRVRARQLYYDGAPFQGLPLGQVSRGDVSREMAWVGPDANAYELDVATAYDADGNPIETKDARGGGRLFTWDPDDHTSIRSESIKLETSPLVEQATLDAAFGVVTTAVGFNGQVTSYAYDAFGRVTAIARPGDTGDQPTLTYTYEEQAPLSRVITDRRIWSGSSDTEHAEHVFDGLNRDRATLARDAANRWALSGVELLDARGMARRILQSQYVSDSVAASVPLLADGAGASQWRDALGRTVRTLSNLGIETRHAYLPLEDEIWDGAQIDPASPYEHTPTVLARDGLDRLVSRTETLHGNPVTATFTYDAAGDLLTKVDPERNTSRYGYDGQGRRVRVVDPDSGIHGFQFDATGNLTAHQRPTGVTSVFTYDLAGRELTQDWDGDGVPEVHKQYDRRDGDDDPLLAGMLARTTDPSGGIDTDYDIRRRAVAQHHTVDGSHYDVAVAYDDQDREYWHRYPDGSSINIERNARGFVSGIAQAVQINYDADGLETTRTFNTGVAQADSYDADRRLHEQRVQAPTGNVLQDLTWAYDGASNILGVQDLRPGVATGRDRTERYAFDNLYRLTDARGAWGTAHWDYSPSGNIVARSSPVAALDAAHIAYGAGAGPHAPTSMDGRVLRYDAGGHLLDDGQRAFSWDAAEHLVHVQASSGVSESSTFDADGDRRIRVEHATDGTSHTIYFLGPWSEVRDGQLVRFIVHGDKRIARLSAANGVPGSSGGCSTSGQRPALPSFALLLAALLAALLSRGRRACAVAAPAGLFLLAATVLGCAGGAAPPGTLQGSVQTLGPGDVLLLGDAIGSLTETAAADGTPQGSFATYPYGVTRYDSTSETDKYAGTPRDTSVGLDQMGARSYASDLGIWTSADPLTFEDPTQTVGETFASANAYGYANGDPVHHVDRGGHIAGVDDVAVGTIVAGALLTYAIVEYVVDPNFRHATNESIGEALRPSQPATASPPPVVDTHPPPSPAETAPSTAPPPSIPNQTSTVPPPSTAQGADAPTVHATPALGVPTQVHSRTGTYDRPSTYRAGVRGRVWNSNIERATGRVRDPVSGRFMSKDKPWDMGHKPGYEFKKHQHNARQRGIPRNRFLDEHNDPSHYRPEEPGSNRSHKGEDTSTTYKGNQ